MIIELNTKEIYASVVRGETVLTSRSMYKAIKNMDHKEFDGFLASLCLEGYQDGVKDADEALRKFKEESGEQEVDFDEVLKVIASVKGVNRKVLDEIEVKCKEAFA